jgi:hypothetical protein
LRGCRGWFAGVVLIGVIAGHFNVRKCVRTIRTRRRRHVPDLNLSSGALLAAGLLAKNDRRSSGRQDAGPAVAQDYDSDLEGLG